MGSAGRSSKQDPVSANVLIDQLFHGECISQRTRGVRSAIGNQVRFRSFLGGSIKRLLQNSVSIFAIRDIHDLRSEQLIEQQISRGVLRLVASQNKDALKSKSRCGRRGLAAMIGLQRAAAD